MFKKILNTFGTRAGTAVINLVVAIVLTQVLGAEGKGAQGLIITTIAFILVFANLVGGATLVYLTPRYRFSLLLLPSYLWSLLVGLMAYIFLQVYPVVAPEYSLHIALLAIINSAAGIHSSLLIGKEKITTANLVNIIVPVATLLSLAGIFFLGDNRTVGAYVISLYIAYGMSMLTGFLFVLRFFGMPSLEALNDYALVLRDLFRYGFLNQLAHITQMLSFRLSYYILDEYHGAASVGIYSTAIMLAESIWLISKSISLVQYARIANTNNRAYAASLTVKLMKAAFLLSIVMVIPLLLFPEKIYRFVFGPEFGSVRFVISSLAAGVVFYTLSILAGHYFSGRGKYWVNAIVSSIGLVVSVSVYFIFIPGYAELGAGYATSISYLFTSLLITVWFARESGTKLKDFIPNIEDFRQLKQSAKR